MTAATETSARQSAASTSSRRERLSRVDTDALWSRRESPAIREELVRRFLPLARRLALRYRSANEPADDLVQVANLGLLGAIDRFDPGRGAPFPAFAIPTILGGLKRHFRQTGWSAHVPRGAQELALRVDRATQELTAQTGRSPRVDALAEHLGIGIEDVLLGLDAGMAHFADSLDTPNAGAGPDEPGSLIELIGEDDPRLERIDTSLSLAAVLPRLPYSERRAVTLRLERELKQAEIAQELGCSQMQVSRLLRRAALRIRSLTDPDLRTR